MQIAPFSAGITGYHPAYFGPGTTGFVSPQATGYGFQPQVLPQSMRGVPPNFMMPYPLQRQGPPGQRMVPPTRRVGNVRSSILYLYSSSYKILYTY